VLSAPSWGLAVLIQFALNIFQPVPCVVPWKVGSDTWGKRKDSPKNEKSGKRRKELKE
jgi:hypothetical protein